MVRAVVALSLLAALATSEVAAAQSSPPNLNAVKLAQVDGYLGYNDIWGYVAPDGREYACLGLTNGISIVNCTDPLAPYEVGSFPGTFCTWRDLKTYNQYLYVVNDCSAGIEVIDMSDPEEPVLVNVFALSQIQHSHNVAIDVTTGILYAVGTQNGMHVYDLDVDPIDPPRLSVWGPNYVHDISIKDVLLSVGENINPARDLIGSGDIKSDTVEFVLTRRYFENLGGIMQEYLTTTSVGDLIRKARGTQDLPRSTKVEGGFHVPSIESDKGRDLS